MTRIGADARIRFLFRTHDGNGLLAYTSRSGGSYLAVELVDGRLVAVSDDGSGPRYVRGGASLADGQWHEVDITRAGPRRFLVRVDGEELDGRLHYASLPHIQHELVYVGGVPQSIMDDLPSTIRSRKSYVGCMSTLVVNGRVYDLQELIENIESTHLLSGCHICKHLSYNNIHFNIAVSYTHLTLPTILRV